MKKLIECPKCLGMKEIYSQGTDQMIPCSDCKGKGVVTDTNYEPDDEELIINDDDIIPFDDNTFYNEELNGTKD